MAVGRLDPFLGKHGRGTDASTVSVPRWEWGHAEEGVPSAVWGAARQPGCVSGGWWLCRAGWDKAGFGGLDAAWWR